MWLLSHYPGRIVLRTAATCIRIELFDRSMTIGELQLWEKAGGRSGTWRRPGDTSDPFEL